MRTTTYIVMEEIALEAYCCVDIGGDRSTTVRLHPAHNECIVLLFIKLKKRSASVLTFLNRSDVLVRIVPSPFDLSNLGASFLHNLPQDQMHR